MEIVTADIGGTNARFAIAEVEGGRVLSLGEPVVLKTAEHASLQTAWEGFARHLGRPTPPEAAIAVACPVDTEVLKLTNNPWVIRPAQLPAQLGVEHITLINDFGAVGHAVAAVGPEHLAHLSGPDGGPDQPLPESGTISVIGPGTGLGVALVLRRDGHVHVIECEGGHMDFSPVDRLEDGILQRLRDRFRRVSSERVVSGPGLLNIYEALAAIEGRAPTHGTDTALWQAATSGEDALAAAALERFCLAFGTFCGDVALVHGAKAVVLAGGIVPRIANRLAVSGFADRFTAKGRFETNMAAIPVKRITHPQPGLYGAAAAFAMHHAR